MNRSGSEQDFSNIEDATMRFIEKQRKFLLVTSLLPVIVLIEQFVNVIFLVINPPPHAQHPILTIIPLLVMLSISFLLIIHAIIVINMKNQLKIYYMQRHVLSKMLKSDKESIENFIPITKLLYDTRSKINNLKVVFLLLNGIFILFAWWVIRGLVNINNHAFPNPPLPLHIANITTQLLLFLYLILHWRYFIIWQKKEKKLKKYEKEVYEELTSPLT
ncbi:MAG: hypothetical protein ACTSYD_08470 [Candidatus Heimdallarchaeaceae archaeon]